MKSRKQSVMTKMRRNDRSIGDPGIKKNDKNGKSTYQNKNKKLFAPIHHSDQAESQDGQEEKFRTIFENANDLIAYISIDGIVIDVNRKVEEIFGYPREKAIGSHVNDFAAFIPNEKLAQFNQLADSIQKQPMDCIEMSALRIDCTPLSIETTTKAVEKDGEINGYIFILRNISKRKHLEKVLKAQTDRLEELVKDQKDRLEDANTTLKVLIERKDEDQKNIERRIHYNIKGMIIPAIERLEKSNLNKYQQQQLEVIKNNLGDIRSPLIQQLYEQFIDFTKEEIQVAKMIMQGKTSKEIASLTKLSVKTIDFHRDKIRKKMGIHNKKKNLRTALLSLSKS
jgi:PAS domain S-box-containing protein